MPAPPAPPARTLWARCRMFATAASVPLREHGFTAGASPSVLAMLLPGLQGDKGLRCSIIPPAPVWW